ncbi:MAG TPA: hypothetical protein VK636_18160 [Gemmatimonadaceae bacterium]|nr:hypothetical protein [Gemmatimonadaceae bacterium]
MRTCRIAPPRLRLGDRIGGKFLFAIEIGPAADELLGERNDQIPDGDEHEGPTIRHVVHDVSSTFRTHRARRRSRHQHRPLIASLLIQHPPHS